MTIWQLNYQIVILSVSEGSAHRLQRELLRIMVKMKKISLYIHLPWCVRKCPYCDFNSHASPPTLPEAAYVTALLQDLDEHLPVFHQRELISIFFGGGTPSLFSPRSIEAILRGIDTRLTLNPHIEITLEANPGTVEQQGFYDFGLAGINRLSLGIQSLQDSKLKTLGRIHDRNTALAAIASAKTAGLQNINLDLMFGLPHQSCTDALADLELALAQEPQHLSWYQLTIEPNTVFYRYPPTLPTEDHVWEMQNQGQQLLSKHGFTQYEVSAYSRPGYECQHNRHYWEFGDYLGIGAGAHSKITDIQTGTITRHWQIKQPRDYLNPEKQKTVSQLVLSEKDKIFEFMLNALRLTEGVPVSLFTERTGLALNSIQPMLAEALRKELLLDPPLTLSPTKNVGERGCRECNPLPYKKPTKICPSELGKRFLNDL